MVLNALKSTKQRKSSDLYIPKKSRRMFLKNTLKIPTLSSYNTNIIQLLN